jgi:serine/threonine protein kinase
MANGNVVDFLRLHPDTNCVHLVRQMERRLCTYPLISSLQALDVTQGLEYLHSLTPNIIHGDLKGVRHAHSEPGSVILNLHALAQCPYNEIKKSLYC